MAGFQTFSRGRISPFGNNMEIRDLADRPAVLLEHGYVETEEETTSPLRSVWFSKAIVTNPP